MVLRVLRNYLRRCDYYRDRKKYCKGCEIFKMLHVLQSFKMLQMLQCFSKYCKNFQKKNVAGAAGLFECCGEVYKRCKCARFPKT